MEENIITYEQPLNERVRLFLRLEHLFQQASYTLYGESDWDSRASIDTLTNILEILSRSDIKTELLKYLDKLQGTLARLQDVAAVNTEQLHHILGELENSQDKLFSVNGSVAHSINEHHLISSILQRKTVAAGTSHFDLPLYHFWLQRPAEERINALENWYKDLDVIRTPVSLLLQLIRNSADAEPAQAEQGFFQKTLDTNRNIQMIRVFVPLSVSSYAEVSGGKHRVSVRFLEDQDSERPVQSENDINFHMSYCSL